MAGKPKPIEQRFWAKVDLSFECWEWNAYTNKGGYGEMHLGIRGEGVETAHRISWKIHYGEIPNGLFVCHSCDNRKCVRPDHLFLGTHQDNMKDMFEKQRDSTPPRFIGERNHASKLTQDQVAEIKSRFDKKKRNQSALAREFRVSRRTIHNIVYGLVWKHV